jgi:hypothetical protein
LILMVAREAAGFGGAAAGKAAARAAARAAVGSGTISSAMAGERGERSAGWVGVAAAASRGRRAAAWARDQRKRRIGYAADTMLEWEDQIGGKGHAGQQPGAPLYISQWAELQEVIDTNNSLLYRPTIHATVAIQAYHTCCNNIPTPTVLCNGQALKF